jgi:hypothetical protein
MKTFEINNKKYTMTSFIVSIVAILVCATVASILLIKFKLIAFLIACFSVGTWFGNFAIELNKYIVNLQMKRAK